MNPPILGKGKRVDDARIRELLNAPVQVKPVRVCIEGLSTFGVARGKDNNGLTFITMMFGHPNGTQYEVPLSPMDAKTIAGGIEKALEHNDDA